MAVKITQSCSDLGSFLYNLGSKSTSLFGFHEIDDFFGGDFSVVDGEGVSHGILVDEVEHFHTLDVVLLVDEEVQLLPLLSHDVELGALIHEVAHRLQHANVNSYSISCACF